MTATYRSFTQLEWAYAGSASRGAATSGIAAITVDQNVHAAVTPTTVRHGTAVKVYGTVSPSVSGRVVTIQRLSGSTWVTLGHATEKLQTLPDRRHVIGYVFPVTFSTAGTRTLRVTIAATTGLGTGISAHVTLKVT